MSNDDLTGKKFSRLTVLGRTGKKHGAYVTWYCICDCGNTKITTGTLLKKGVTGSCGCLRKEASSNRAITHGKSRSREYFTYRSMMQRCYDVNHDAYHNYGGRGIIVCDRWAECFENFYADMGNRPNGHTLDRYPNIDGGYGPDNCRWASTYDQARNHSRNNWLEHNGIKKIISDWERDWGIPKGSIYHLMKRGRSFNYIFDRFNNKK